MPIDPYQSQRICVKLDSASAVLTKAKKFYWTDIIISGSIFLFMIVAWCWIWLRGGHKPSDWVVAPFLLLIAATDGALALNGFAGVRRMAAEKTVRAEHGRIVEEYRFGVYAKPYVKKTKLEHVEKATLHFNQLELTTKENRQIVMPYALFGSKEEMRSYADTVCDKAGIELQVLEGVA